MTVKLAPRPCARLVSKAHANKVIGAKAMDHCSAGGIEWRTDFVERLLSFELHRPLAHAQGIFDR